ncbi:protein MIZU-KUSSEI 1-like [Momordica charantia]|uniref:Protein MIZU-KUSSEI 1-like n=1 Tax=Momordica charantia TaxID=3673 RepID=A0A6J1DV96_MOMCH|nr:protein MIZU-KUSSEI 1-like [Momordica charantia]
MKTIMANSPHDSSFSFSRRYLFHYWKNYHKDHQDQEEDGDGRQMLSFNPPGPRLGSVSAVSKLRWGLGKKRSGRVVVGTIFGQRRGHVHFSLQEEASAKPTFLIEVAMPTSALVREMASGVARMALECEKTKTKTTTKKMKKVKLGEEAIWRAYCNGKKYGWANRLECGAEEWRVLRAVGPITVGAGVLPLLEEEGAEAGSGPGEVMFMRAKFERVVGSSDSEAFYMINPDGVGGPDLTIFLLRV